MAASSSYSEVARHVTEMVQIAEEAGFHIVWSAEHHGIEMTIAPDAFQILTWLAAHTSRIRLGTAVVVSPYAHPVRVAGQAALLDVYSDGRLGLGLGPGASQWEMGRMKPGLKQSCWPVIAPAPRGTSTTGQKSLDTATEKEKWRRS